MNAKKLAYAEQKTSAILNKVIEETKSWEAEGKDAWTALRNLKGNNLAAGDEIVIARLMHIEIKKLKTYLKSIGKGIGEFCLEAGLGNEGEYSKELYRLTLAPESNADKVRLRKSAAKYRQLIAAISKETKESSSVIANRVLVGTTLHPAEAKVRDEVDQIQGILQALVDIVDQEFGLYATFMETAKLKVEHAKEGGELRWPHNDRESRLLDFGGTLSLMRWPGETLTLTPELTEIRKEIITREIEHAINEKNAYWSYKFGYYNGYIPPIYNKAGCIQDDEFFYVPHVHIGYIELGAFNHLDKVDDMSGITIDDIEAEEVRSDISEYCEKPDDSWDSVNSRPVGQHSSIDNYLLPYHAWIVIYPTPDNTRLMPMLYMGLEEFGPFLLPLDAAHLNATRQVYCFVENKVTTVFKHIDKMLGIREQTNNAILDGFRRTAPWLRHNPFLKLKLEKEAKQKVYADYHAKILSESLSIKGQ